MAKRCTLGEEAAATQIRKAMSALRRPIKAAAAHEVEGIHDLRVASRRFRETLEAYRSFLPKARYKALRQPAREVTRGLGTARELDVTLGRLAGYAKQAKGPMRRACTYLRRRLEALREAESPAVDAAVAVVQAEDFRSAGAEALESIKGKKRCVREECVDGLQTRLQRLQDAFLVWEKSQSEEALHQTRIAFKQLRYRCEIARPFYSRTMKRQIDDLKKAQAALGDWNDLRVLRDYADDLGDAAPLQAAEGLPALREAIDRDTAELLDRFHRDAAHVFEQDYLGRMTGYFASPSVACCAVEEAVH